MGCFGYICKGCNTSIRGNCFSGGEKCVLIHVRNGAEVGRVEGHYDEYGRVIEQANLPENEKFRGNSDGINGHRAICESEYRLVDSYGKLEEMRVYKGKIVDRSGYFRMLASEIMANNLQSEFIPKLSDVDTRILNEREPGMMQDFYTEFAIQNYLETDREYWQRFLRLRKPKLEKYSGVVAWHSKCYKDATDAEKQNMIPSKSDPNQSWGRVRKKYK